MAELSEKRVYQQIRNFERAMDGFEGDQPFSRYLTTFFKENKQMGSSDRRSTSRLCYNYFRLGQAASQLSQQRRLVLAEFLCEKESPLVELLEPEYSSRMGLSLDEKIAFLEAEGLLKVEDLFPFTAYFSAQLDTKLFLKSQLVQPHLYIRVKRGKNKVVRAILDENQIPYSELGDQTISLPNGTSLQRLSALDGLIEVQDLSSQRTLEFMKPEEKESWWDACAASGGKSLLLMDACPSVDLLVSDLRMSILRNLDERFDHAGIKHYRKKILDLTKDPYPILGNEKFDGVLLDAPCTGSGTWGRTPEMIREFKTAKIAEFSALQKTIAGHVAGYVKVGKPLIYITCSVFKAENEDVVDYILSNLGFELESMRLLDGYTERADSMFVARLIKK
ncbi:MAG: methyltransferase [Sphingobacterium sp.]|jgi:16S rRNA (cytosine967-C5)-methyltransferase|uniref:RsmB/NOP family class I SAM-dependent RNA methyltransferase n=1 Tax=unclassified Sphingobacterium TaxID=2609468 RepID=UPI0009863E78|nr:RsmB/NOP family class I SAM-dependent RNA methyltransferase [Sphingobacterium sp. CZ-UAM]MDF2519057.1 methyltransferase [Sphingobacterium sp.]OOG19827.1 RNA methyltransferase [Sphingobacterium sp. CZ-UAM]